MVRAEPKKGRPDLQGSLELDAHLMATAAKLFIEHGYEGTSMGQIVAAAGAGKQSLYRRYANKEALFRYVFSNFVMKNIMSRSREQLETFQSEAFIGDGSVIDTLYKIAWHSFTFVIERETIETFRLFIAERNRFPELKGEIQQMMHAIQTEISRHIHRAQTCGLIRHDIDQDISHSFMALLCEGPLVQSLLDLPIVSSEENKKRYFDSAWKTFIDAVIVRP